MMFKYVYKLHARDAVRTFIENKVSANFVVIV